jgi:hypothetical protein
MSISIRELLVPDFAYTKCKVYDSTSSLRLREEDQVLALPRLAHRIL